MYTCIYIYAFTKTYKRNHVRMLRDLLNKSWKYYPTKLKTTVYIYIYIYIYKPVRLKTADCFLFKIFQWKRRNLLVIFPMSRSRCWRKCSRIVQALIVLRCCVRSLVAVSSIHIYLECFSFYYILIWGWLILLGWVVGLVIEYV